MKQLTKPYKSRGGFTLMEILLVLGIFSTTLLLVINIFVSSSNLQQRTIVAQRLTADARYTIETIARAVRSGTVDYDFYSGRTLYLDDPRPVPPHILSTIDQDGNRTIFRRKSLATSDPWGLDINEGRYMVGDQVEVCFETSICVNPDAYSGSSKDACNTLSDCNQAGHSGELCTLSCQYQDYWS
ncbi:MAG: type II secretion system protein, partial [Pseudomonadota bacterium]